MQENSGNKHSLQVKMQQQVLPIFTSIQFLKQHSLYSHLFSSEKYTMSSTLNEKFVSLYFGKESIEEGQLYEFTYFHKRDKKLLIHFFILQFLTNSPKNQMVIFQNGQKINTLELREFISNEKYGGAPELVKKMEERIIFLRGQTHQVYKLNLQFLSLIAKSKEFLKVIMLSDINEFQSGDKSSLQRIYKKINKNLLILSFKKDIYDYKFITKSSVPYMMENQHNSSYQLHEKVIKNVNRQIAGFNSHHSYLIPIEQIGIPSKNIEQTYRSVIIRKDGDDLNEYIFSTWPFQTKAYRKIN